ncbi:novel acetylcholine receptor chaperone-like [Amphiura filiformis]|uniref:novel acetylcholine receptor chaperone-like n=1 Tax=Amphiura filiformis TaxID=82378 RepID=UPI003B22006F
MAKSILIAFSACIGLYFMYTGFCKMSPGVNENLHNSMKKHFVNYARVAPLRTHYNLKWKGMNYRKFVAGLEITGGAGLLVTTSHRSRTVSYILLLFCVGAMLHTYQTLGDPITKVYTLLASGAVIIVQMIIERRVGSQPKQEKEKSS